MNKYAWLPVRTVVVAALSQFLFSAGVLADTHDDLRLVCPEPGSGEDPYYQRVEDGKIFSADGPKDLAKLLKICYNMMLIEAISNPGCGNGVIEGDESCDGVNLDGASCESLNWNGGGVLSCNENCIFDTSNCIPTCDDGILNGDETGIDCGGGTCSSCSNGELCVSDSDCTSGICDSGVCVYDIQCGQPCDGGDLDLCEEGVNECTSNSLLCSDDSGDNQELCNGLDDDCDGAADEGINPAPTSVCHVEICSNGTLQKVVEPDGTTCMVGQDEGECQAGQCQVPCNSQQQQCSN